MRKNREGKSTFTVTLPHNYHVIYTWNMSAFLCIWLFDAAVEVMAN